MTNLTINETHNTPAVNLDAETGILEIKGRSLADDIKYFYKPVISWIDNYIKNPHQKTVMKMFFLYYNSGTSKNISDILKKLEKLHKNGFDVKVQWYYDEGDEGAMEDGEDFKDFLSVPIEVIESK